MDRNKILMIFGGAWLSAAVLAWFLYSTTAGAQQAKLRPVVAAARDLSPGVRLKKTDLKRVNIPERDVPSGAIRDEKDLLDRALVIPVSANEVITGTKIASMAGIEGVPSIIPPGKRAVSVLVQDSSSAAGLILPRAHVDVLVTRAGSLSEAVANTILQDVVVLSVGRVTELQMQADQKGGSSGAAAQLSTATGTQRAVTLIVTPEEAQKLELAKNAGRISLSLRNPSDTTIVANPEPVTGEVIDPLMGDRRSKMAAMRSKAMTSGRRLPPNVDLRDDRAWARLIAAEENADQQQKKAAPAAPPKKEAPKPRAVVDVYRGDKHVQEIFPN